LEVVVPRTVVEWDTETELSELDHAVGAQAVVQGHPYKSKVVAEHAMEGIKDSLQ
jgi:hypothetical protein